MEIKKKILVQVDDIEIFFCRVNHSIYFIEKNIKLVVIFFNYIIEGFFHG